ncbi:unnamed protein product [Caenorhabditis sp. 36 PRJEB53466]|nr:unnamed protein product [Caenorhabditis sp. 36 PRJEB53466]
MSNDTDVLVMIYISLYVILLISSLLYIPIMVHLRKNVHLPSVAQNRPHKYILYQTIAIVAVKLLNTPFPLGLWLYGTEPVYILLVNFLPDIITTPLVIQFSYLCANKRNAKAFFSVFLGPPYQKLMLFIRKSLRRSARIHTEPDELHTSPRIPNNS